MPPSPQHNTPYLQPLPSDGPRETHRHRRRCEYPKPHKNIGRILSDTYYPRFIALLPAVA